MANEIPDMSFVTNQLASMHSQGLLSSVRVLGEFLTTMIKNNSELFDKQQQYDTLFNLAESLYENSEYKKAKNLYERALQVKKEASKLNIKLNCQMLEEKYKIHLCYLALNEPEAAHETLISIQIRHRTSKIHMALAKSYTSRKMDRQAISSYKEVLKKCPFALDAIMGLIELGEPPKNFLSHMNQATSTLDWLTTWITGFAYMQMKDYNKAVHTFDVLNKKSLISGNARLMCSLAQSYYYNTDENSAMHIFEMVRNADPYHIEGMDLYAAILYEHEQSKKLENFAAYLFALSELHAESWVSMGYDALANGDHKQAVYLATQATKINARSIQGLFLKGLGFKSIKPNSDVTTAITHFREVIRLSPHFFKAYDELVRCLLRLRRNREAMSIAETAMEAIGFQANTLTLYALVQSPNKAKMEKTIDKALSISQSYKPAIKAKTKILYDRELYSAAVKFALENISLHPSSEMHTLLAKCYLELKKYANAAEHFTTALRLEPSSKEAQNGLKKIEYLQKNNGENKDDFDPDSPDDDNGDASNMMWADD